MGCGMGAVGRDLKGQGLSSSSSLYQLCPWEGCDTSLSLSLPICQVDLGSRLAVQIKTEHACKVFRAVPGTGQAVN